MFRRYRGPRGSKGCRKISTSSTSRFPTKRWPGYSRWEPRRAGSPITASRRNGIERAKVCRCAEAWTPSGQALASHRAPGAGGELPPPGDDHDRRGADEQNPGTDEPTEIAQRKEERALAPIEMPARGLEQSCRPDDMGFGLRRVALRSWRHRTQQDG